MTSYAGEAVRADFSRGQRLSVAPTGEEGSWGVQELSSGSALLVVKRGHNVGSWFMLDLPITSAGRDPGSDIFLDEVSVGRHHAEFRRENDGVRIVDTDSLSGTFVNRVSVHSAVLGNGDEIQIGKFHLVFLTVP